MNKHQIFAVIVMATVFLLEANAQTYIYSNTCPSNIPTISDSSGTIGIRNYINNCDATFTFRASDSSTRYFLTIEEFNLETSSSCSYDYITFANAVGLTTSDRFCGYTPRQTSVVQDSDDDLVLTFHTDSSVTRLGFTISYTATSVDRETCNNNGYYTNGECICDDYVTGVYCDKRFLSPYQLVVEDTSFSQEYIGLNSSAYAEWVFNKDDIANDTLWYAYLELTNSTITGSHYVYVTSGIVVSSDNETRIIDTMSTVYFNSPISILSTTDADDMRIRFPSSIAPFSISVETVPITLSDSCSGNGMLIGDTCICSTGYGGTSCGELDLNNACGSEITLSGSGTISHSENYPNSCSFSLTFGSGELYRANVTRMDFEYSSSCSFDYITFDNLLSPDNYSRRICRFLDGVSYESFYGESLILNFVSDSTVTDAGLTIEYEPVTETSAACNNNGFYLNGNCYCNSGFDGTYCHLIDTAFLTECPSDPVELYPEDRWYEIPSSLDNCSFTFVVNERPANSFNIFIRSESNSNFTIESDTMIPQYSQGIYYFASTSVTPNFTLNTSQLGSSFTFQVLFSQYATPDYVRCYGGCDLNSECGASSCECLDGFSHGIEGECTHIICGYQPNITFPSSSETQWIQKLTADCSNEIEIYAAQEGTFKIESYTNGTAPRILASHRNSSKVMTGGDDKYIFLAYYPSLPMTLTFEPGISVNLFFIPATDCGPCHNGYCSGSTCVCNSGYTKPYESCDAVSLFNTDDLEVEQGRIFSSSLPHNMETSVDIPVVSEGMMVVRFPPGLFDLEDQSTCSYDAIDITVYDTRYSFCGRESPPTIVINPDQYEYIDIVVRTDSSTTSNKLGIFYEHIPDYEYIGSTGCSSCNYGYACLRNFTYEETPDESRSYMEVECAAIIQPGISLGGVNNGSDDDDSSSGGTFFVFMVIFFIIAAITACKRNCKKQRKPRSTVSMQPVSVKPAAPPTHDLPKPPVPVQYPTYAPTASHMASAPIAPGAVPAPGMVGTTVTPTMPPPAPGMTSVVGVPSYQPTAPGQIPVYQPYGGQLALNLGLGMGMMPPPPPTMPTYMPAQPGTGYGYQPQM